ncbi:MAG: hypothetical protein M3083_06170 [Actinomycetota bacterium]|nr:hypothetical protein [Actinomycetota bacterium]MDQ6945146.1 hypothetical protein [Actinomycetota bacterium]
MGGPSAATIEWLLDVAPAAWLGARLHPFFSDTGSVIPPGFGAYARLFHPVEAVQLGDRRHRWADVARETGRIVHPEMQFHMISRPIGEPPPDGYQPGVGPSWGSLPLPERRALAEVLGPATTTPQRCWFCLWEGFGGVDDPGVAERVRLPRRDYLFYTGALEMALVQPPGLDGLDQSPNLWWPDDRAWCVATDIDYAWTYVGGTRRLIDSLLEDERFEILPAKLTDRPFYDSDLLNAALDVG